jgi:hypothetical protein
LQISTLNKRRKEENWVNKSESDLGAVW